MLFTLFLPVLAGLRPGGCVLPEVVWAPLSSLSAIKAAFGSSAAICSFTVDILGFFLGGFSCELSEAEEEPLGLILEFLGVL